MKRPFDRTQVDQKNITPSLPSCADTVPPPPPPTPPNDAPLDKPATPRGPEDQVIRAAGQQLSFEQMLQNALQNDPDAQPVPLRPNSAPAHAASNAAGSAGSADSSIPLRSKTFLKRGSRQWNKVPPPSSVSKRRMQVVSGKTEQHVPLKRTSPATRSVSKRRGGDAVTSGMKLGSTRTGKLKTAPPHAIQQPPQPQPQPQPQPPPPPPPQSPKRHTPPQRASPSSTLPPPPPPPLPPPPPSPPIFPTEGSAGGARGLLYADGDTAKLEQQGSMKRYKGFSGITIKSISPNDIRRVVGTSSSSALPSTSPSMRSSHDGVLSDRDGRVFSSSTFGDVGVSRRYHPGSHSVGHFSRHAEKLAVMEEDDLRHTVTQRKNAVERVQFALARTADGSGPKQAPHAMAAFQAPLPPSTPPTPSLLTFGVASASTSSPFPHLDRIVAASVTVGGGEEAGDDDELAEFENLERTLDCEAAAGSHNNMSPDSLMPVGGRVKVEEGMIFFNMVQKDVEESESVNHEKRERQSRYLEQQQQQRQHFQATLQEKQQEKQQHEKQQEQQQEQHQEQQQERQQERQQEKQQERQQEKQQETNGKEVQRRVAASLIAENRQEESSARGKQQRVSATQERQEAPPQKRTVSKLVRQRFGGPNLTLSKRERERREQELEAEIENRVQNLVADRIAKLEKEIKTYKEESGQLRRQKIVLESTMTKLKSERAEFETYKKRIQTEHENLMQSNRERLVKEKRILERQVRAQLQMPNRKDRSEIDSLRATIEKMRIQYQKKEGKWKVTQRRMQDRNGVLKGKLQEVEETVHYLQEQLHERKWSGSGEDVAVRKQSMGARRSNVPKKENERYSFDERFEVTAVETAHAIMSAQSRQSGQKLPEEMLVEAPAVSSNATQQAYNPSKYNTMTNGHTDYEGEGEGEEGEEERGEGSGGGGGDGDGDGDGGGSETMDFDDRYEYLQKEKDKLAAALEAKEDNDIIEEGEERLHPEEEYDNRFKKNMKGDDVKRYDSLENGTMGHCDTSSVASSIQSITTASGRTKVGLAGKVVDTDGVETVMYEDGKKEKRYPDGKRMLWFRNGTIKEILQDGSSTVKFANGDIKKTHSDTGLVVYFYASANTTHTTYNNGVEIFEFPNGQVRFFFFFFKFFFIKVATYLLMYSSALFF